ncbi:MAG: SURF1 family cytochrome oxidase biogenesis protein [Pseudomonadota bacterium]
MTFRPMPILTVLSIISFAILIMLGNWQYERYSQKADPAFKDGAALATFETVEVMLHPDAAGNVQQVNAILNGEAVWRRYVPVLIESEAAMLALDATGGIDPIAMPLNAVQIPATLRVNRFKKPAQRSWVTNPDRPEQDIWFTRDAAGMAANTGLTIDGDPFLAEPEFLIVRFAEDLSRTRQADNPYAYEQTRDPLPAERHLGYALTWWGIAIGLIGIYVVMHTSTGRLRFRAQA